MPARTNTEKIEDVTAQVLILRRDVEHLTTDFRAQCAAIKSELTEQRKANEAVLRLAEALGLRVAQIESFKPSELPVVTGRVDHLKELLAEVRTRRWQLWLAVISAIVALAVALLRRP